MQSAVVTLLEAANLSEYLEILTEKGMFLIN